ncbi:hypothetical protein [Spirosoma pomorum]
MMLIVTLLDGHQSPKDFAFQVAALEEGLTFISKLVAKGEILLRVALVDKHSLMLLPVMTFDGADFSGPMQQLEAAWKAILSKPINRPVKSGNWVKRLMAQCELRIIQQQQQLTGIRYLITQLAEMPVVGRQKQDQIDRYCQMLIIYEAQLSRTCALRQRLQQWRNR